MTADSPVRLPPSARPSPRINPDLAVRAVFDGAHEAGVDFYLFADVIEELTFSANSGVGRCFAILIGGFGKDSERLFIEVSGFSALKFVEPGEGLYESVRPVLDAWVTSAAGVADPAVGLFVGVPGSEGRMDDDAALVHMSLFNVPFQPLVVFDPAAGLLGTYSRPPSGRFFNAAFSVVGGAREG